LLPAREGGGGKSSDDEDSTLCNEGRCAEGGCTIGEKLPGALGTEGPVDCDIVPVLEVGLLVCFALGFWVTIAGH
jgi:hypothetical protein